MSLTKNLRKIALFVLFLIFNFNCFSQTALNQICDGLSANQIIKGDFKQEKYLSRINKNLESSGTFIICPEGIAWQTEKPFNSTLAVGLNFMVQIKADGTKSVINASQNPTFASIAQTISSLFSGNINNLQKDFQITLKTDENGRYWTAELIPLEKTIQNFIKNITVSGFFSSSVQMNQIVLGEANGDKITYFFSNQTYPKELNENEKQLFKTK